MSRQLEAQIKQKMKEIERYLEDATSDSSRQKYLALWIDLLQELVEIQKSKAKPKKVHKAVFWSTDKNELIPISEVNEK